MPQRLGLVEGVRRGRREVCVVVPRDPSFRAVASATVDDVVVVVGVRHGFLAYVGQIPVANVRQPCAQRGQIDRARWNTLNYSNGPVRDQSEVQVIR